MTEHALSSSGSSSSSSSSPPPSEMTWTGCCEFGRARRLQRELPLVLRAEGKRGRPIIHFERSDVVCFPCHHHHCAAWWLFVQKKAPRVFPDGEDPL